MAPSITYTSISLKISFLGGKKLLLSKMHPKTDCWHLNHPLAVVTAHFWWTYMMGLNEILENMYLASHLISQRPPDIIQKIIFRLFIIIAIITITIFWSYRVIVAGELSHGKSIQVFKSISSIPVKYFLKQFLTETGEVPWQHLWANTSKSVTCRSVIPEGIHQLLVIIGEFGARSVAP